MLPFVIQIQGSEDDKAFMLPMLRYLCEVWGWLRVAPVVVQHELLGDPIEPLWLTAQVFSDKVSEANPNKSAPPIMTYYQATEPSIMGADVVLLCDQWGLSPQNFPRLQPPARLAILESTLSKLAKLLDEAYGKEGESSKPPEQGVVPVFDPTQLSDDPDLMAVQVSVLPALADGETLKRGMERAFATCFPQGCRDEWERWLWGCMVQGMLARIPELSEVAGYGAEEEKSDG